MPHEEYRRQAAECLRVANEVTDPQSKRALTFVAHAWLRLAEQGEQSSRKMDGQAVATHAYSPPLQPDVDGLRMLLTQLKETDVADLDLRAARRIGEVIARAAFDGSKALTLTRSQR